RRTTAPSSRTQWCAAHRTRQAHAFSSPRPDEFSILIEFHDSRVARRRASSAVSIGDEDVAVRSDRSLGRLVEFIEIRSGNTRLAERHQESSVRAELQTCCPFPRAEPLSATHTLPS